MEIRTHLNCHTDKAMIYDACKKKLALQFPDDRRSYTEGKQECIECLLKEANVWKGGIITEGAAYLPELMKQSGVPGSRYISITPTKEFQVTHYRKRDFVPLVLEGCSDKEAAFLNWLDRDALFAQEVRRQCHKENYVSVINDGNMDLDELAGLTAVHFGFKSLDIKTMKINNK